MFGFENGYMAYQQGMGRPQRFVPQQPQSMMPQNNGIIWVQGEVGAKAYQVAPNTTTVLFDSENDLLYIKISDNIGMCQLRTFHLNEITGNTQQSAVAPVLSPDFVNRNEFEELKAELAQYKTLLNGLNSADKGGAKNGK